MSLGESITLAELEADPYPALARLRADFAHFDGLVREHQRALHHDEQVHCSVIHVLPASVWRAGPAQLVGDAEHACSPMLAQGAALCLGDSWLLAQLLSTKRSSMLRSMPSSRR